MKRVKRGSLGNFTAKNGKKLAFLGVFVDGGAIGSRTRDLLHAMQKMMISCKAKI
jgi:hypothetical protein